MVNGRLFSKAGEVRRSQGARGGGGGERAGRGASGCAVGVEWGSVVGGLDTILALTSRLCRGRHSREPPDKHAVPRANSTGRYIIIMPYTPCASEWQHATQFVLAHFGRPPQAQPGVCLAGNAVYHASHQEGPASCLELPRPLILVSTLLPHHFVAPFLPWDVSATLYPSEGCFSDVRGPFRTENPQKSQTNSSYENCSHFCECFRKKCSKHVGKYH